MVDRPLRLGYSLVTVRPGQIGGAETYVRGLLAQFVAAGDPQHVRILANAEVAAAYRDAGAEIHIVRGMEPGGAAVGRTLRLGAGMIAPARVLKNATEGLDLVHFPVAVAAPRPRIPHVVTLHDVAHHAVPEFFSRASRAYRAVAYDRSARNADYVITDSEHARGQIIKFLGVDPERITAIHLGIDLAAYTPDGSGDDVALAGVTVPDRFVYYPANMWPHKNHALLIEAFARVADRGLHLVLTGQTYGRDAELVELVRRAGVSDRVHHLGYVAREVVPALYRRALGVVFPSLFEGFGSPPLEAMACGAAVASSRSGSLEEVLGGAGLPFDANDPAAIAEAVDRIANDAPLRSELAHNARSHAERFTWEAAAKAHAVAYRTVVQDSILASENHQ